MNKGIKHYLICDTQTDLLSIQTIDWSKFVYEPTPDPDDPMVILYGHNPITDCTDEYNSKQEYLKQQITSKVPHGVIVATEIYDEYYCCYEWDALNFIKFEIHSNFTKGEEQLSLLYFLRPLTEKIVEGLNILFGNDQYLFEKEEHFELSQKGWQDIFKRAIFLHNSFSKLFDNIDNTPYYNSDLCW